MNLIAGVLFVVAALLNYLTGPLWVAILFTVAAACSFVAASRA